MANPQGRGTITVEVVGLPATQRGIANAKLPIQEAVEQVIHDAGEELLQMAQINLHRMKPPGIDTGALVGSLKVRHGPGSALVYSDVKHSVYIEFGTRPHFPPIAPLLAWVKRKLHVSEKQAYGVARKVQSNIGKRGTPPRPFLGNAFAVVRSRLVAQVKAAVASAIRRAGNK